MAKSQKSKEYEENNSSTISKLIKSNPYHLLCGYGKVQFEVLGGVNHENYHSLHIMLLSKIDRYKQRETVDLYDASQVLKYQRKLSEQTSTPIKEVQDAFFHLTDELEGFIFELRENKGRPVKEKLIIDEAERKEAETVLNDTNLLERLQELMNECGVIGNDTNRMILFLVYLTRKMNTSLHAIIQSDFNGLQSKMTELIPVEERVVISHISDNALFYYPENELQNKVVLVEDTVSNRKNLIPLLGFQNKGVITKTTVQKNENLELETFQKNVFGNVSLSISTPEQHVFHKFSKQSIVLFEETGAKQDEAILLYQRKQSAGLVTKYQENKAIQRIHTLQRVLQPITVINPYAMELVLPKQIQYKQITNLQYLRFIEIITFLKQYQRTKKVNEVTGEEFIETTLEDIKEANKLLSEVLVNKSDRLSKPTREFFEQLKEFVAKGQQSTFTMQQIIQGLLIPRTSVRRHISVLIELGYIQSVGGNRNTGIEFELLEADEYKELVTTITNELQTTIKTISMSCPHNDQSKSGQPKTIKKKGLDKVIQKVESVGVVEPEVEQTNTKVA